MSGRMVVVLGLVLAAVTVVGGAAIAGHQTSGVKSYTGCLVPNDGVIVKVKEGNAPKSACTGGQVEAHFSGGDITAIAAQAGGGLVGGGDNGAVSFSIRRDCAADEVVKWNGSAWACAADDNSTYTAGTGLDLDGSEFSIEESYRLPQTCASGEAATRNPAIGGGAATWTCDQFATADQACASGQFARGITAVGALSCAAPSGAGLQTFVAGDSAGHGIPDSGSDTTVVSVSPPAGTYLVIAKGDLRTEGNVTVSSGVSCALGSDRFRRTSFELDEHDEDHLFALTDVVTTTGGPIALTCNADVGADGIAVGTPRLVALKVG